MLAVTAYEAGQIAGQATLLLLVAAVLYRFLLQSWLAPRVARPVRAALAGAGVIAIVVFSIASGSARGDGATPGQKLDPNRAQTEMVAGCVDTGGERQRSYCECVADRVMASNGTTDADLHRLNADIRAVEEKGAPIPAVLKQSVDYCAGPTG